MAPRLPALHLMVYDHLAIIRALRPYQQALYMQICCYCHLSHRRGFLQQPSGKPFSKELLAQMTGFSVEMVSQLLQELLDAEVISCSADRIVFVAWIVEAERQRLAGKEFGKLGGNPALKGQPKGGVKGTPKGRVIPIPEDENEISSGGKEEGGLGEEGREGLREALIAEFRLMPFTHDELQELTDLVDILAGKRAEPSDIAHRAGLYRKKWPTMACTPRAVVKWWDLFAPKRTRSLEESPIERAEKDKDARRAAEWEALSPEEREHQLAAAMAVMRPKGGRG